MGIEVPYKMTVIHSRPQESPLFLKFSFSVKCKVFVWATVRWSRSASASCQGTGAKCEAGKERIWSEETGLALVFTLRVCSTSHMRCKQDCLVLPSCWEAKTYVINLGVGEGRGRGWNCGGIHLQISWAIFQVKSGEICDGVNHGSFSQSASLHLLFGLGWVWKMNLSLMSKMAMMNVKSRVGMGCYRKNKVDC